MLKLKIVALVMGLSATLAAQAVGAEPKLDTGDIPSGARELAFRYGALAQETLRQKVILPPHFRQSAALLMAAMRLDPQEPRYPRMLYEAMLQLHDQDAALKALKTYRGISQQTADDQVAMLQYIDLTVSGLETAEERLEWLRGLMETQAPAEVRAHAAMRASQIARERGQSDLEQTLRDKALELNPLNFDALKARMEQLDASGAPADRVGCLLQMLRSNPVLPGVTHRIARECAQAGLVEDSLRMYILTVNLAGTQGLSMGRDFGLLYASELFLGGQPQYLASVKALADEFVKVHTEDVEIRLLRWLAERTLGDKEAASRTSRQIVHGALNRLLVVREKIGVPGATTRPVDTPEAAAIPSLGDDVKRLNDEKFAQYREAYEEALIHLTWYLVYVDGRYADAAKLIPTLKALRGENDPAVARIEGWSFLLQNQIEPAKLKLRAAAENDTLALMGWLLIRAKDPAQKEKARAEAAQLLAANPTGLAAAVLASGLSPLGVKIPLREDAPDLRKKLDEFPREWLRIIDSPQSFYTIRGEMLDGRVLFPFGEPMMARVTIRNTSNFDITIGPDGVLRHDLWFDAQFRGLVQQNLVGAAYDRIGQVLVLKPGQMVSRVLRLDQGQLAGALASNPQPVLTFYAQVRTNPRTDGTPGPCGYGVPFAIITERAGINFTDDSLRAIFALATTGSPAEKLRTLELFGAVIEQLKQQEGEQPRALVTRFTEAIERSTHDPVKGVATWAMFLSAVQSQEKRNVLMEQLLSDPDPERRLLGLMMANGLPPDQQKQRLTMLLGQEKEEMVRMYCSAMLEIAQVAAASQKPAAPAGGEGAPKPPVLVPNQP